MHVLLYSYCIVCRPMFSNNAHPLACLAIVQQHALTDQTGL